SNGNCLEVEDHFFKYHLEPLSYLNRDNIPQKIQRLKFDEDLTDIVILFGSNVITTSPSKIVLGNDIIAGTFFMLTRWEEYVITERDRLGRFSVENSLGYKGNFVNKPIV